MKRTSTRLAELELHEWQTRQGRGLDASDDSPLNGWLLFYALIGVGVLVLLAVTL